MDTTWSPEKVEVFKTAFYDFLSHVKIFSKDYDGPVTLVPYGSQARFLDEMFEGLGRDIHWFVILKARQLGLSTVTRALILFWAFMHRGSRIALIYDTDKNKEDARQEIKLMLRYLPATHRIAVAEGGDNRDMLQFVNDSRIAYFVAGIKKSKSSGGLGRSRGINVCGATEVSSWADLEGLRAFERSLSQKYPNRLYIWESTARGFNIFYDLWEEAVVDDLTKKAIFIGWWAHAGYAVEPNSPLFEKYGFPPSEDEQHKIDLVKARYGHEVSMEQLAWYRHEYDPNVDHPEKEHSGQDIIMQELPWFEEEAFLKSGANFFSATKLTEMMKEAKQVKPQGYRYSMSEEFIATIIEPVTNLRHAHLKIWEEPQPDGIYCIGADPAGASSEEHCRHVAQVLRCYADGCEQVAEFATMDGDTRNFAWVLLHLCGAYGGASKGARFLLELNGVGNSVLTEIKNMRLLLKTGYLQAAATERGLTNIMDHVKNFLWTKDDQLTQNPTAFHWETNTKRKVMIMERMRDYVNMNQLGIRSVDCIEEMEKVVRTGDSIGGDGSSKDDRVLAMALALRAWEAHERKPLIQRQWTKEAAHANRTYSTEEFQKIWQNSIISTFFAQQQRERKQIERAIRKGSRWSW